MSTELAWSPNAVRNIEAFERELRLTVAETQMPVIDLCDALIRALDKTATYVGDMRRDLINLRGAGVCFVWRGFLIEDESIYSLEQPYKNRAHLAPVRLIRAYYGTTLPIDNFDEDGWWNWKGIRLETRLELIREQRELLVRFKESTCA